MPINNTPERRRTQAGSGTLTLTVRLPVLWEHESERSFLVNHAADLANEVFYGSTITTSLEPQADGQEDL